MSGEARRRPRRDVRRDFEKVADEIADTIFAAEGETRSAYALMRLSRTLSRAWAGLYNGGVDARVLAALRAALEDLPIPSEPDLDDE